MWIIPKSLHTLASVQDTEALISDSQELSELYAQSLLWRSKHSPSRTWSRRLKQGGWIEHLSTATLKPSHTVLFEDEWTYSQEASLVSHLVTQDEGQETKIQDTCGPTSPKESESWDTLPLFSSRTSRASSAPSSKETDGPTQRGHLFCSMSSENWSAWVTEQRQEYSQRAKSVRPISANECSFWVVAPISVSQGEGLLMNYSEPQSKGTPTQRQEAQSNTLGNPQGSRWTTPIARDHYEAGMQTPPKPRKDGTPRLDTLPRQVHTTEAGWATPTTRDYKGAYSQASQEGADKLTRNLLPDQAHGGTYKGKLNPRWVETLMGVPVGWTMPSCANPWTIEQTNYDCSETESYPPQQSEPSESFGDSYSNKRRGDSENGD